MDSFFGIGAAELVVILFLAGIVMGPKRIRQVAFWLGKVTAQLQAVSRGFTRQLNAELSAIDDNGDMKDAWGEVQDLRQQLADLKREITSVATQPIAEGHKAIEEAKHTIDNTIHPPNLNSDNRVKNINSQSTSKPQNGDSNQNGEANLDGDPGQNGDVLNLPNLVDVADDPE
jgi:Sec-independent protein translocase protein TatA